MKRLTKGLILSLLWLYTQLLGYNKEPITSVELMNEVESNKKIDSNRIVALNRRMRKHLASLMNKAKHLPRINSITAAQLPHTTTYGNKVYLTSMVGIAPWELGVRK